MSTNLDTLPVQFLNGMSYAALLFLVAAGFTLVFGLARVLNFAHGAIFMLGAFVVWEVQGRGWGFMAALVSAAAICGVVSGVLEKTLVSRMYGRNHLDQVLMTLGVALVLGDVVLRIWGGDPRRIRPPTFLEGTTEIFGRVYPYYRLGMIVFGLLIAFAMYWVFQRTTFGVRLRAAVSDTDMAAVLGVNTGQLFTIIFAASGALAGMGAALAGPVLGASIGMDQFLLIDALIVVVIGGAGSVPGALVGSVFLGLANTAGQVFAPDYASFLVYGLMVIVLLFRPSGLFGRPVVVRL